MKKKYRWMMALVMAGALGSATFAGAAPNEAQLMKQAKISRLQAEKIALARVPHGKIQSQEIEKEHHALVWSFDIVKTGAKNVTEVLVNAKTGEIISVSTETPGDQAREKAADKVQGQK